MNTSKSIKLVFFLFIYLNLLGFSIGNNGIWECETVQQCTDLENGECREGQCRCPVGYLMNGDHTGCVIDSPYLYSPCEARSNCNRLVTGFECHDETKICVCREGYHYLSGRCWESVGYGESCLVSSQCHDPLQPLGMECRENTCVCKDAFYQRELGQCRKRATALGDGCVIKEDCQISDYPEAECDLTTLVCVDPESEQETEPTPEPEIEIDTEAEPELVAQIIPINGYSHLPSFLASFSMKPRALAFEECYSDEDCSNLGPAFCSSSHMCICNHGYYPTDNNQACLAELGTRNPVEGTCSGFLAEVDDDVCACKAGHFYTLPYRDCRKPSRLLGESCLDDISCRTFGLSSYCETIDATGLRHCVCDETTSMTNVERQFCEPFVTLIGESCETDNNCPGTSECIENICACAEGSIPNTAMVTCLLLNLEVGEECSLEEQCSGTQHTGCINNRCTCVDGYVENVENKECLPGVGGPCDVDGDCSVTDSICQEIVQDSTNSTSECRCAEGFVHDSSSCYRMLSDITSECDINAQCYNLGSNDSIACTNGVCACTTGHHFNEGGCYETKALGELCTSSPQCYLQRDIEGVECRNSVCQCLYGYRSTYNPDTCSTAVRILSLSWMLIIVSLITRVF